MSKQELVLKNARVFTALNTSVIDRGAVWIVGNTIQYAGPEAALPATSADCEVIDVGGRFIMPGMTECHAHLSFADTSPFDIGAVSVETATITAVGNAEKMLSAGFTSAVSFGSNYRIDVAIREAWKAGKIKAPRLLAAGRDVGATASNVDSPGGLSQIADGPWELRKVVREQRKAHVDVVKIFVDGENINRNAPAGELTFHDEEINAIVDEAHRRRMKVATHSRSAAAVKQALRAGADFIGHANYLDDEAIAMLTAQRDRIFVGPAIAWEVRYVSECESIGISRETVRAQGYEAEIQATVVTMKKLHANGVRLVVGGDYGIGIARHGTYARDVEYFVDLFGMSAADALICATRNGGLMYDQGGSVGTLAADTLADLIVVDGDPLADVRILQDHARLQVMQDGRWI
ncbi:MAG: amidohydrolase family protein [Pseudomonadales bacterium]|nr:amidohydrolase family protein [Pseudomonadales bacterium]MCP5182541.1 amidohydrolase family protein [Pseudomonadales bacterium]